MSRVMSGAVALVVVVLAVGCGGDDNGGSGDAEGSNEPIVIGVAVSRSGFLEPFDVPPFKALQLKLDEVNKTGGIDGRKIKVITRDTKSDVAGSRNAARALIDDGAEIIVAPCDYDIGSPAAQVAQTEGILSFSLCAQSPKFGAQGIGPLAYTVATATFGEGVVLAEFARDRKLERSFILADDIIVYGTEVCQGYEDRFTELGGTIAGHDTFKNTDQSVASQVSNLKQANADSVVLCSYPPGGASALRQIRAAGIDVAVMAPSAMDGTYWTEAVPDVSNLFVAANLSIHGDDPNADVNEWVTDYEEFTGGPPLLGMNAVGYSVGEAIVKALEEAGSTKGEALAEVLDTFEDEELLIGLTTFTPEQHIAISRPLRIIEFSNGKPGYLKMQDPGAPPEINLGG